MDDKDQNKLFVGGISWETTYDVLKEHFGRYGTVSECVIAKDRNTGSPRGFAFVAFVESSAVDRALGDSHQILSRMVQVKRAVPRREQQMLQLHQNQLMINNNIGNNGRNIEQIRTKKIFVGGLSANLTQEEFRAYFQKFGRIVDVVVMHDNITHRPRGFGFITFDSEDSVEEVMKRNFHELAGKLVEVKRAVPKDGNNSSSRNAYTNRAPESINSHQQGTSYSPFNNPGFGYFPTGGYVQGYNPYVQGLYPPVGGFGYGFVPIVPRVPSALFGNATPFYPSYLNVGPSVMSVAGNGYGAVLANGFGGAGGPASSNSS